MSFRVTVYIMLGVTLPGTFGRNCSLPPIFLKRYSRTVKRNSPPYSISSSPHGLPALPPPAPTPRRQGRRVARRYCACSNRSPPRVAPACRAPGGWGVRLGGVPWSFDLVDWFVRLSGWLVSWLIEFSERNWLVRWLGWLGLLNSCSCDWLIDYVIDWLVDLLIE